MKKRILDACFTLYCAASILVAYSAVDAHQVPDVRSAHQETHVETLPQVAGNHQRLHLLDAQTNIQIPRIRVQVQDGKSQYKIVIWCADWCAPCQQYKAQELPAILKAGYKVQVLDYDRDNPPKSITSVPTVVLYYRGKIVKAKPYWLARDLDQFVENRLTLKE